jgi:hypothetical protein
MTKRKKKSRGPRIKTFKGMISSIRSFMMNSDIDRAEKVKLWEVLTALRGPDFDDDDLSVKDSTTAVIRQATFETQDGYHLGAMVRPDTERARIFRRDRPDNYGHFWSHALRAFEALGMDWLEVNPPRPVKKP